MALRVRPRLSETVLRIAPRGDLLNPLAGYRCDLLPRLATLDDPVTDRIELVTDRQGRVTIPADPAQPLKFLQVYSGQALLARVPILPGLKKEMELDVPDDRARLSVEGEVALLQSELIDIVARREVLMARTRAAVEKGNWPDVDALLAELQRLPTLNLYQSEIESLEVRAVYVAKQAKDRVGEARIRRLCRGVRESAEKHLDPARLLNFRQDINSRR
jgi:hypothetical protein